MLNYLLFKASAQYKSQNIKKHTVPGMPVGASFDGKTWESGIRTKDLSSDKFWAFSMLGSDSVELRSKLM